MLNLMQKCISTDTQALNLPAWLQGINSAHMSVRGSEFSPSTYALHVVNRILFMYGISY